MIPYLHDRFDAQRLSHKHSCAGDAPRFARVFQAVKAKIHALLFELPVNQREHILDGSAHFQLLRRQNGRIAVSARIAAAIEEMDVQLFLRALVFLIEALAGAHSVEIRGGAFGIDQ